MPRRACSTPDGTARSDAWCHMWQQASDLSAAAVGGLSGGRAG
jgi:hypothetical protein